MAMNAGCYGTETWEIVERVQTIGRKGELRERSPGDYRVGYRHVRGRADDSDKGRVVLAEEIKPLEDAVGNGSLAGNGSGHANGHGGNGRAAGGQDVAHACRIRVSATAASLDELLASVKAACYEHEGRTPLFVHVLLPTQEVVLRVKELGVDPAPDLVAKVEGLLGPGSILVEYAGRA